MTCWCAPRMAFCISPTNKNMSTVRRRLTDFVRRHRDRSAQGIADAVLAEVSAYSTASMNDDDKVLIVMKVTADKEAAGCRRRKKLR